MRIKHLEQCLAEYALQVFAAITIIINSKETDINKIVIKVFKGVVSVTNAMK